MTDITKVIGAGALAALLLATPALADFHEEWDADADGLLSEEEFRDGFDEAGVFEEWDEDGDGLLAAEEFEAGLFGGYDDDADGLVGEAEIGDVGDDLGEAGLFDF